MNVSEGSYDGAFAELVRAHSASVFRLALSILGKGFDAEAQDVVQEVFMKVHHALPRFRGESDVASWIYRIAFNHALNMKERARFRRPHLEEGALSDSPTQDPGPLAQAEARQRARVIEECMQTLPEVYQSALRLYYWLGASTLETASLLDVPENTVKSYLYRARRLLEVMLTERGYKNA